MNTNPIRRKRTKIKSCGMVVYFIGYRTGLFDIKTCARKVALFHYFVLRMVVGFVWVAKVSIEIIKGPQLKTFFQGNFPGLAAIIIFPWLL
ncbi:hypothetical protein [Cyclobacterium jeungdonense]|uniref:EamA domain-containing protein n=1 Tax=Cyclobacterium jeungdonense TaxID=708087 RepID=A0ABT8C9W4_9BACT|nr:hypothetical protein [Cyclobacterium jeungdonense]MDN3689132.1 hypothetical protein [Cyclobacterium jeungdonense]